MVSLECLPKCNTKTKLPSKVLSEWYLIVHTIQSVSDVNWVICLTWFVKRLNQLAFRCRTMTVFYAMSYFSRESVVKGILHM